MTRVLPLPAPARISTGPSVVSTASRCCGFSWSRKDNAEVAPGSMHSILQGNEQSGGIERADFETSEMPKRDSCPECARGANFVRKAGGHVRSSHGVEMGGAATQIPLLAKDARTWGTRIWELCPRSSEWGRATYESELESEDFLALAVLVMVAGVWCRRPARGAERAK